MRQLQISQVDVLFANGNHPIEFLLFFPHLFDTGQLRKTLRRLSSAWWPFFGIYEDGHIIYDGYKETDCFDEEVCDNDFELPVTGEIYSEDFFQYAQPDLVRLSFLKVIRFRNGIALIPKLNHLAGDGYSYFTFLAMLAMMSRKSVIPLKNPILNLLLKPHHHRTVLKKCSFSGVPLPPDPHPGDATFKNHEIPAAEVQSIIREGSASDGPGISINDVLSAMALKKIVESQHEIWRNQVTLTIPIDVRTRVPEFGRRFVGNALQTHTMALESDTILDLPVPELARSIRRSMPSITSASYSSYLEGLEALIDDLHPDAFRPFDPETGCLVTNLTRMPTDRLDFGSGPPVVLYPLTSGRHAAALLKMDDRYIMRIAY
ncbi:acyltransferase [Candidatus Zixiibacteriota bacterium]